MHSATLERNGYSLRYCLDGPQGAPAIVFTHGAMMDHSLFEPQIEAFRSDWRVLTYDMQAHGQSTMPPAGFSAGSAAQDLTALLDKVGIGRAVLVGHSLGGTVSQLFAIDHPERVAGFAGLGCACATMPPTAGMRAIGLLAPVMARTMPLTKLRERTVASAGVKQETRDHAASVVGAMPDDAFASVFRAGFGKLRPDAAYRIRVPLLLFLGDRDDYAYALGTAPKWAERDGGRLVRVPDAGHNTGRDNPQVVNAELRELLAGLA